MIDRIKGLLTKMKLFRFFKIALIVIFTSVVFLSLFGTVAHATGLVDDTVNADNLYSQYPLGLASVELAGRYREERAVWLVLYHQLYLDYQPVSK